VQEKAIAYPTDSRLLEVARRKLVKLAVEEGLTLRQSYEREGPKLRRRAGGYAHAKQFKRLKRVLRRQRTVLGRLMRDIERKLEGHTTRTPVIPPFLVGLRSRHHAAMASRCFGVIPPKAMFGRS
jgi:IS5 family transposase